MQFIASVAIALCSTLVASFAAVFTYRNNFGWKPLCIVNTRGVGSAAHPHMLTSTLDFEVWNRRKYPIALRGIKLEYPFYDLAGDQPGWIEFGPSVFYQQVEGLLAPTSHAEYKTSIIFNRNTIRKPRKAYAILCITYFDPRSDKVKEIIVKQSLFMSIVPRRDRWRWLSPARLLARKRR